MKRSSASRAHALPAGTALVETVVLITLSAVLSGMIVTGMAALIRVHHALGAHRVNQTALQQLATTLRGDIHRATSCQWNREGQVLGVQLPQQTRAEYLTWKHRWVRVFHSENEPPVTTSYGVDEAFRGECLDGRVNRGELLRLRLINQPFDRPLERPLTERTLQCEIVAEVGRDYALEDE